MTVTPRTSQLSMLSSVTSTPQNSKCSSGRIELNEDTIQIGSRTDRMADSTRIHRIAAETSRPDTTFPDVKPSSSFQKTLPRSSLSLVDIAKVVDHPELTV